jgi:NAD(P)-dependent dehydrogenase (short-subunit alcohol dehydrogenase family)
LSVWIVTGAGRGIGAATARRAAAAGHDVAVNYRTARGPAEAVAADCRSLGVAAVAVAADVAVEAAVRRLFDDTTDQLGPVSVLVNNAGILHPQTRLEDISVERFREVLDVNVIGAFLCARGAVRRMSTRFGGAGGAADEVAATILWLASDGASYVTGALVNCSGGR